MRACVRACVCVCVSACVRACMCVCLCVCVGGGGGGGRGASLTTRPCVVLLRSIIFVYSYLCYVVPSFLCGILVTQKANCRYRHSL